MVTFPILQLFPQSPLSHLSSFSQVTHSCFLLTVVIFSCYSIWGEHSYKSQLCILELHAADLIQNSCQTFMCQTRVDNNHAVTCIGRHHPAVWHNQTHWYTKAWCGTQSKIVLFHVSYQHKISLGGFNMNAIIPMRRMVIISTLSFHEVVKDCNALEGKSLMIIFFCN